MPHENTSKFLPGRGEKLKSHQLEEQTYRDKERESRRLKALVKESILHKSQIHSQMNHAMSSIEASGFHNHVISRGHTVQIKDPLTGQLYVFEYFGDIFEGGGASTVTGQWPLKKRVHLPASMEFFSDVEGHGTYETYLDKSKTIVTGAEKNNKLFITNKRVRNIVNSLLSSFGDHMFSNRADTSNMRQFLSYAARIIEDEVVAAAPPNMQTPGGAEYIHGILFGTNRLPLKPGTPLDLKSHFVELSYIPAGNSFYLVQGDNVHFIDGDKSKSFALKQAGSEFAKNYNCEDPTNENPNNPVFGFNPKNPLQQGTHILKVGPKEPPSALIVFTDGVDEQRRSDGKMLHEQIDIPSAIGKICKSAQFNPFLITNGINDMVNKFRGAGSENAIVMGDDATIFAKRIV